MKQARVAAVVLAAGGSTRLGQPKQLVQVDGECLVNRAVRVALAAGADPVFVALGAQFETVLEHLKYDEPPVRVLVNHAWRSGMASSIALGAAAAGRVDADALLVLACDQPAVTPRHLRELMLTSKCEHVVASAYAGRRGVPAIFPELAFHALQDLSGDWGARTLLQRAEVLTVPLPGGEFDVDTPDDLEALLRPADGGVRVPVFSATPGAAAFDAPKRVETVTGKGRVA